MPPGLALRYRRSLEQHVDLEQLLRLVVDDVVNDLEADRGTLYLVDHARSELVSRVAHLPELAEIRLRIGEGIAGWVARKGVPVRVARDGDDRRFTSRIDRLTGYHTQSMLAAPVKRADGVVIGVLQVLNKTGNRDFQKSDERQLVALAAEVAELLAATSLRSQLAPAQSQPLGYRFNGIVGESKGMREVYDLTTRAANSDLTVLVRGESGTGKEAIVRAVHFNSPRRDGPFVKVDCAALPAHLIENELFGHLRGAFTGADQESDGKVHAATGGTLFLDEVADLPGEVQGKLLRLLQDRAYIKVGGSESVRADVRFVCATNRDLESLVEEKLLREDLYYRIRVVEIVMPPLRDRGATDLDRLIDHFLFESTRRQRRAELELAAASRATLHAHKWRGNVRELENTIEAAVVLCPGSIIEPGHLRLGATRPRATPPASAPNVFRSEVQPLHEVERSYVRFVVDQLGGNRTAAARALGIGRNTLLRKLRGE